MRSGHRGDCYLESEHFSAVIATDNEVCILEAANQSTTPAKTALSKRLCFILYWLFSPDLNLFVASSHQQRRPKDDHKIYA